MSALPRTESMAIHGVVLAAGRSSRMGESKPLLEVGSETFLTRAVGMLRESGCDAVTVVVSATGDEVRRAAEQTGAAVVVNPQPGSEQVDSLRQALRSMAPDVAAVAVLPVDLPGITERTTSSVIAAWRRAALERTTDGGTDSRVIAVPSHEGRRGHPVVLGRAIFADVLEHHLPAGLRTVLDWHEDDLVRVPVDDAGIVADIDTPDQYRAARLADATADARRNVADVTATNALSSATAGDARRLGAIDGARAAMDAQAGGPVVAIVAALPPAQQAGARMLVFEDGRAAGTLGNASLDAAAVELGLDILRRGEPTTITVEDTTEGPGIQLYAEAHRAPEELLIVGAGHIAVPLAKLGLDLEFRVTVLDDREEFASAERFPAGARVLRAGFEDDPFAAVTVAQHTYVVLVTRGHKWDFDCLRRMLELPTRPRYVGMIGSRRRVRAAFTALLDAGVRREDLARVHAPIGLEIGAETPAEIAVSIAAELIHVRRGVDVASLTSKERVLDRLLPQEGPVHG